MCVDRDLDRLRTLADASTQIIGRREHGRNAIGKLYPVCADLSASKWPFSKHSFSVVLAIHFLKIDFLDFFYSSLVPGGYLYTETFGGQGKNYLDLPKTRQLHDLLSPSIGIATTRRGTVDVNALVNELLAVVSIMTLFHHGPEDA